jgi:hypothetical protein
MRIEGGEVGVLRLLLAAQEAAAQQQAAQEQRNEQQEQEEQKEELVAILAILAAGAWNQTQRTAGADGQSDIVVIAAGRHEAGGAAGGQGVADEWDTGSRGARASDEQPSAETNGLAKCTAAIYCVVAIEAVSVAEGTEIGLDASCCCGATLSAHVINGSTFCGVTNTQIVRLGNTAVGSHSVSRGNRAHASGGASFAEARCLERDACTSSLEDGTRGNDSCTIAAVRDGDAGSGQPLTADGAVLILLRSKNALVGSKEEFIIGCSSQGHEQERDERTGHH